MFAFAQVLRHLLIVGDAVAIEHQHDDGALHGFSGELAEGLEAVQQARHADGQSGGRNLLAGEALDEPIIASAAYDRAEADRLSALILDGRGELSLENGAGVIFEPAHDGWVKAYSIHSVPRRTNKLTHALNLLQRGCHCW